MYTIVTFSLYEGKLCFECLGLFKTKKDAKRVAGQVTLPIKSIEYIHEWEWKEGKLNL